MQDLSNLTVHKDRREATTLWVGKGRTIKITGGCNPLGAEFPIPISLLWEQLVSGEKLHLQLIAPAITYFRVQLATLT